jgi:NAD(P)-dependent dehydrogenase (short-subunit alcohol dehydrogenase family)
MNLRQLLRKPFTSTPFATPMDLTGRHIIVTGCSAGSLGYETARQLANWGAVVIISTRNNTAVVTDSLRATLAGETAKGQIDGHNLDLSDAASVEAFSLWYREHYGERLDCLINNAGIHLDLMSKWKEPKLTADGHEIQWRTNYLGTVHLTSNLLPILRKTGSEVGEARVVNVISQLHSRANNALLFDGNRSYESWQAYGLSKLGLIHFTRELDRRYATSDSLKSYCLHPGGKSGVYTNVADKGFEGHALLGLLRKLGAPLEKLFMATAGEGAQTQLYCATAAEAESGGYFVNCQRSETTADGSDSSAAGRLWQDTDEWLCKTANSTSSEETTAGY